MGRTTLITALALGLLAAALPGCTYGRQLGILPKPGPEEVLDGDPPEVIYSKAQRLFAAEHWDDAAEAFAELWQEHPTHALAADARFYEAESRYGEGKYHGAYEKYKRYLGDHPLSPHAPLIQRRLYDIGTYLVQTGMEGWWLGMFKDTTEGVEVLDYLVSAFPNGDLADDALIFAADAEATMGSHERAIHHLQDLIDLYPGSEWALEARLRLGRSYRALNRGVHYDADALKRAHAELRSYIDLVERDPDRAAEYGELLDSARAEAQEILELLATKRLEQATYYLKTGKTEAAQQGLRNLVKEYPETEAAAEARRQLGLDAAPDGGEGGTP